MTKNKLVELIGIEVDLFENSAKDVMMTAEVDAIATTCQLLIVCGPAS